MSTCQHCGYFIEYEWSKAPGLTGWVHTGLAPERPTGPPCDDPAPITTDLSDYERATVERIEAAPAAPESFRERVAVAIFAAHDCGVPWERLIDEDKDSHRHLADAAIATMRGES